MNFCPSCGMAVVPGARFCGECGHELIPREQPVEAPAAAAAQIWSSKPAVVVDPEAGDDDEELFTHTVRRSDIEAMQAKVADVKPSVYEAPAAVPPMPPMPERPRYEPAVVVAQVGPPDATPSSRFAPQQPAVPATVATSPELASPYLQRPATPRPASTAQFPPELLLIIGLMVVAAGICFYIGLQPLSSTLDLLTSGYSYGFEFGLLLVSVLGLFCLFGAALLYLAWGLSRADRVARGLAYVLLGSVAATLALAKVHTTSTKWVIAVSLGALAVLAVSPNVARFFREGPSSALPSSIAIAVTLLKAWAAVVGILGLCLLPIGSSVTKLEVSGLVMVALAAGAIIAARSVLVRNPGGRSAATIGAIVTLVLLGVVGRDFESVIVPMTVALGILAFLWLPAESTAWFGGGTSATSPAHQWTAAVPEPLSPVAMGLVPAPPSPAPFVQAPRPPDVAPAPPPVPLAAAPPQPMVAALATAESLESAVRPAAARPGDLPAGGYTLLTIRTGEEDDGRFYPLLGDNPLIEREPSDGARADQLIGVNLTAKVAGGAKNIAQARKIKAVVLVTDARVAVACEKYDKGGGWVGFGLGGIAVSLTANVVSKTRARRRSRGKVLVGQVRYPWLAWIGYSSHPVLRAQTLRMVVAVPSDRGMTSMLLDVGLPMSVNAASLTLSIAQQAARYQLQHNAGPEAGRSGLVSLLEAPKAEAPNSAGFTGYSLAWALPVSGRTAYPP
jgi:hypothetical protein